MLKQIKKHRISILIFSAFIISSIIHFYFFNEGFYSISADESGRTLEAAKVNFQNFYNAQLWLPLYKWIVKLGLIIWNDLFITPRVIIYIFGLLTTGALILLSNQLFKNFYITILTALFLVLFPDKIILSIAPMAEIMFIFFTVLGLLFFSKWFENNKIYNIIISAVSFNFANMVRYEAWIFAAMTIFLLTYLYFKRHKKNIDLKSMLVPSLIISFFPLFWFVMHAVQHGSPFAFLGDPAGRYVFLHGNSFEKSFLNSVIYQFFKQNFLTLNIVGLIGVAYFFIKEKAVKTNIIIPVLSLLIMSALSLLGKGMPSHNFWRIASVWNILLIPFTAYFCVRLSSLILKNKFFRVSLTGIIVIAILIFSIKQTIIMTKKNITAFSKNDLRAGRVVGDLISKTGAKILIDSSSWNHLNVRVASNYPDNFVSNSGYDPMKKRIFIIHPKKRFDRKSLEDKNIEYILFNHSVLKKYMKKQTEVKRVRNLGKWWLYKLKEKE